MLKRYAISSLSDLAEMPCDTIIDVRAPAEFAEDHIAGAINLPVLDDAERARVGTIYVQDSPFLARKLGGALVAKNAAKHLEGPLADKDGSWRPMVYCWRGGQRSGSFASILDQVGWRVGLVEGGYKSYRRLVVQVLYDQILPHRLILIDGGTGSGKSALLSKLQDQGAQVLDLEAMAHHRGSLLGGYVDPQPSQKAFESALALALSKLDPAKPVWVEAESSKIGKIRIPPSVWRAMLRADHIVVSVPVSARAAYLAQSYQDVLQDMAELRDRLGHLVPFHGHDMVEHWQAQAQTGQHVLLAEGLVQHHYDPSYRRASKRASPPLAQLDLDQITEASLTGLARQLHGQFG